jgi:hypothetical protein
VTHRALGRSRARSGRAIVLGAAVAIALFDAFARSAPARAESVLNDRPAPESAADIRSPITRGFDERVQQRTLLPRLKSSLAHLPPFFADAHVNFKARTYYFRDRDGDDDFQEAWAGGGGLWIESGWRKETFKIGAEFFTSQPIVAPPNRSGSDLLAPEQKGYSVLGLAYAKLKYRKHLFTAFRQRLDLPYVNADDSRMTPRTFEGYTLFGSFPDLPHGGTLRYTGGYLTKTKDRTDDRFRSMSESAGASGGDRGMAYGGLYFDFGDGRNIGALDYFVPDVLNIAFAEGSWLTRPAEGWEIKLQAQFTHQQSVGEDRLTGDAFASWGLVGQAAVSHASGILAAMLSYTDRGGELQNPFGSSPSFLSIMQADFDRAREVGWGLVLTYDFAEIGATGLSAFAVYAEGYRAIDPASGRRLPDRREFDLTFDYHLKEGLFRGFWLRARASILNIDGERKSNNQVRVILNYDIPIL